MEWILLVAIFTFYIVASLVLTYIEAALRARVDAAYKRKLAKYTSAKQTLAEKVQTRQWNGTHQLTGECPRVVIMKAYAVFAFLNNLPGDRANGQPVNGFGVDELIALLYAASFPRSEWRERVAEAFTGMEGL